RSRFTICLIIFRIFFFSSRRRHTRFSRDWSSDVCSSDLEGFEVEIPKGYIYFSMAFSLFVNVIQLKMSKSRRPPVHTREHYLPKIGRASCRERVTILGGAGSVKKQKAITDR